MRRLLGAATLFAMLLLPGTAHAAAGTGSTCTVTPTTTAPTPTVRLAVTNVPTIGVEARLITAAGATVYSVIVYPSSPTVSTGTADIPGTYVGIDTVQLFTITDATHHNGSTL